MNVSGSALLDGVYHSNAPASGGGIKRSVAIDFSGGTPFFDSGLNNSPNTPSTFSAVNLSASNVQVKVYQTTSCGVDTSMNIAETVHHSTVQITINTLEHIMMTGELSDVDLQVLKCFSFQYPLDLKGPIKKAMKLLAEGDYAQLADCANALLQSLESFKQSQKQNSIEPSQSYAELIQSAKSLAIALRGVAFSSTDQKTQGMLDLMSALLWNKDNSLASCQLGHNALNRGDFLRASEHFESAFQLVSSKSSLWLSAVYGLMLVNMHMGKLDQACEWMTVIGSQLHCNEALTSHATLMCFLTEDYSSLKKLISRYRALDNRDPWGFEALYAIMARDTQTLVRLLERKNECSSIWMEQHFYHLLMPMMMSARFGSKLPLTMVEVWRERFPKGSKLPDMLKAKCDGYIFPVWKN